MERMKSRLGWALAGALGIILVLALARATVAGPLDPPGPVASTMRTIDELTPSWGKNLTSSGGCASKRFTCVLPTAGNPAGEAVLDHETGLVWQRVPEPSPGYWYLAIQACRDDATGARHGWRLPSYEEISSLQDDTSADGLPAGHPFTAGDTTQAFLSSTIDERSEGRVRARRLGTSIQVSVPKDDVPSFETRYWCVRGGTGMASNQDPPEWARLLDAGGGCFSERFSCVLDGSAVLDRETGLVWERFPSTNQTSTFALVQLECHEAGTGGRGGWRLPAVSEAMSLAGPTGLPAGHPFTVDATLYYATSSTSYAADRFVRFKASGYMDNTVKTSPISGFWCVRGSSGGNEDAY